MKKLIYLFLVAVVSTALTSCVEGDDDFNDIEEVIIEPSVLVLFPGDTESLTCYTNPYGSQENNITWTSSNKNVASVDDSGTVTAIAPGSTVIAATAKNGVKGTCNVIVNSILPKQMIATTQLTSRTTLDFIMRGTGTMTIDWGDGDEIETHTLYTMDDIDQGIGNISFKHTYNNASTYTIKINAVNISTFYCNYAHLISLDVSGNTALQELNCYYNQFTQVTLGENLSLLNFGCDYNSITSLDVSKNTSLIYLSFGHNQLTDLDLSKNTELEWVACHDNQFTAEALNRLFGTLNNKQVLFDNKSINIQDNPGEDACDRSIAKNKGWTVYPIK